MSDSLEAIYPLSPMQQGMLFHSVSEPESGVYLGQVSCLLKGKLDAQAFEASWQRVIDRHSSLRTVFVWKKVEEPRQVVYSKVAFRVETHDWSHVPQSERGHKLETFLRSERTRGFNLSKPPLFRATLIRLSDLEHYFVSTQHHLLADGWCQRLLLSECFGFYQALQQGLDLKLPAAPRFRDYIQWLLRQNLTAAESYFRKKLAGFTEPTVLGVERRRSPSGHEEVFQEIETDLSIEITSRLQRSVEASHVTLNTAFQGAWSLLLSRYSRQSDVLYGMVVSGRPAEVPRISEMVGLFVNTLPVRVNVNDEMTVSEWLQSLQQQQVDLRQFEFAPLLQIKHWSEIPAGRSLFDSAVVFQNFPAAEVGGARLDLDVEQIRMRDQTNLPLTVFATLLGDRLSLRISFDSRLFNTDTVQRFLQHLEAILDQFGSRPQACIGDVSLLSASARTQVVRQFNETEFPLQELQAVHERFGKQAAATPNGIAIESVSNTLTYARLDERSSQLAHYLQSLGTVSEERVGLLINRSNEMVVGLLGILKAGGIVVPLDPAYPQDRLRFMLEDAGIRFLLVDGDSGPFPPGLQAVNLADERIWSENRPGIVAPTHLDNGVYLLYTSGSTGLPKGVVLTHRALANLVDWQNRQPRASEKTVQFSPLSFDVSFQEIFATLTSGGTLTLITEDLRRNPVSLLRFLDEHHVERLFLPFIALQQLAEAAEAEQSAPGALRNVITAGEQLQVTPSLLQFFSQLPECRLHNHYGPTETHVVTAFPLSNSPAGWKPLPPIGSPISNVRIYILDPALHPCPIDVAGELCVGGASLARGYHNRPDLTAERFIPDPFGDSGNRLYRTGDLARWLPDGTIEFLGRIDQQVKIRGFRIELGEIEAALVEHPDIREAAATTWSGGPGGKRLVGYFVPESGGTLNSTELRTFLRQKLPDYMLPTAFVSLESLPLTPSGKVDRRKLPSPGSSRPDLEESYVPPLTPAQEKLSAIWSRVLGVERVGINDNFFELGGDSILSIQIVAKAEQAGLRLTPRDVFENPTIAQLSTVVSKTPVIVAEQGPVTGPVPLTPIQHWFFGHGFPEPHQSNMALMFESRQPLDIERLTKVIDHVCTHHDALRLRFFRDDKRWVQSNANVDEETSSLVSIIELKPSEEAWLTQLEQEASRLQASLNLDQGPLLRVAIFRRNGAPDHILWTIHHLAVDGISWRILLEDVLTGYEQLANGLPIQFPAKTSSFQSWANHLVDFAQSEQLKAEVVYWQQQVAQSSSPLPRDFDSGNDDVSSADFVTVSLSETETTSLLKDVPAVYRTQVNDILLTALTRAFSEWTGQNELYLNLEGHGREQLFDDLDISRTVGWFAALTPVRLKRSSTGAPGEDLIGIKEQLRAIPRRGVGFGILRYLSQNDELREDLSQNPPEVTFNYLGQFDQVLPESAPFVPSTLPTGPTQGLTAPRGHLLELNAGVAQGKFQIGFRFGKNRHRRETIERLADYFIGALKELTQHCLSPDAGCLTPSDVPLSRLSQEDLDRLFRRDSEIVDVYPLSAMQSGILYHSLAMAGTGVYHEQVSCTLESEDLQSDAFRKAWQFLFQRHAILRTEFVWEGIDEPLQIVRRQCDRVPFQEFDWSEVPAEVQEQQLDAFLQSDLQQGFSLNQLPLMRFALVRLSRSSWRLIWSYHHILLDGWSGALLLNELLKAYEVFAGGSAPAMRPPRPFRDFLEWTARQDLAAAEAFWKTCLKGFQQPTGLQLIPKEWGQDDYHRAELSLDEQTTIQLNEFARRHRLTVSTIAHGVWALLLNRYTGATEVLFGSTVSGRPPQFEGADSILGVFINTLPIRIEIEPDATVIDWLTQRQQDFINIQKFDALPLQKIQKLSEVPQGQALFETLLVFENYPVDQALENFGGGPRITASSARERVNYPVTCVVAPSKETRLVLLYDCQFLDTPSAERLLVHFSNLITELIASPTSTLADLPILSAAEQNRLRNRLTGDAAYPTLPLPFSLTDSEVILTCGGTSDNDAMDALLSPFKGSAKLLLAESSEQVDPLRLRARIATEQVTTLVGTPGMIRRIFVAGATADLQSLQLVLLHGTPVTRKTVQQITDNCEGIKVCSLKRTPNGGCLIAAARQNAFETRPDGEFVSIFTPHATNLCIVDSHLRPVPSGVWGEICYAASHEVNIPDLCELSIGESRLPILRTGEQGRLHTDGSLELRTWSGAKIDVEGESLDLNALANVLTRLPNVRECVIRPRMSSDGESWLIAVIVGDHLDFPFLTRELAAQLPASLQSQIAIVEVLRLPRDTSGCLNETALLNLPVLDEQTLDDAARTLRDQVPAKDVCVLVREERPKQKRWHLQDLLYRNEELTPSEPEITNANVPITNTNSNGKASTYSRMSQCDGEPLSMSSDEPRLLSDALQRAAQLGRGSLIFLQNDGVSETSLTYQELLEAAERIAGGLSNAGLLPGDTVLLQLQENQEFVMAFWGCQLSGLIPVPLSVPNSWSQTNAGLSRFQDALELFENPFVLTDDLTRNPLCDWARTHHADPQRCMSISEFRNHPPLTQRAERQPDDIALMMLTSGSTGRAKGVCLRHRNILARSWGTSRVNGFSANDISLNWLPLDHVGGIVMFHLRDVFLGCTQIHGRTQSVLDTPLRWLDWIERFRVTITWAPNFAFGLVNDHAEDIRKRTWDLNSLRFILNGGEAVVAPTARRFLELLEPSGLPTTSMHPAWGMSETSSGVTYSHRFSIEPAEENETCVEVGGPLPGISIRIVDEHDQVVPETAIGRLQVQGASLFQCYYRDDALTRESFTQDGWFKTGDLGFLQDGKLTLTGREKDVIIINGVNFACHEIERIAEEVEGVEVSFTAACAVRRKGQNTDRLAIFFSPDSHSKLRPLAELTMSIRERVVRGAGIRPEYLIPLESTQIPKTNIGKIQRARLRTQFESGEFEATLRQIELDSGGPNTLPAWFFKPTWQRCSINSTRRNDLAGTTLVLTNDSQFAKDVVAALADAGCQLIVVRAGSECTRSDQRTFEINPTRPEDFRSLLAKFNGPDTLPRRILHLWTCVDDMADTRSARELCKAQETGVTSLLHLVQALAAHSAEVNWTLPELCVVTTHAHALLPHEPVKMESGPMLGWLRTLPHEFPAMSCRHVDFSTHAEHSARQLIDELQSDSKDFEVAYRRNRRFVRGLEAISPVRSESPSALKSAGVYLISGGLGGIGFELCRYLLSEKGMTLCLLGRSVLPPRNEWDACLQAGGEQAELVRRLKSLEALGEIQYETVDLADVDTLTATVDRFRTTTGRELDGVFHLAGTLTERLISEMSAEELTAALRPKLLGAWNLHELTKKSHDCLFVAFSSVNALFGGATMASYAAANSSLESLIQYRRTRGYTESYCLHWTMWRGVGMSAGYENLDLSATKGYFSLNLNEGRNSLLAALEGHWYEAVIGLDQRHPQIRRLMDDAPTSRFHPAAFIVHAQPTLDHTDSATSRDRFGNAFSIPILTVERIPRSDTGEVDRLALLRSCDELEPAAQVHVPPRNELEQRIASIWRDVLKVPQVGIHDNFFELGGDSILAIQALSRARSEGLQLSPEQLFQNQTVAALAAVCRFEPTQAIDQGPVTGPVELTPIQRWFFEQDLPSPDHFNMALLLEVPPTFNAKFGRQAVNALLAHHDALRMRFQPDADTWRAWNEEVCGDDVFSVVDFSMLPVEGRSEAITHAATESQKRLSLEHGPLIRVSHFQFGKNESGRLLLVVHHLVIDGVSWRVLLEDLLLAYQALEESRLIVLPPKTTSFQAWSTSLQQIAEDPKVLKELDWWRKQGEIAGKSLPIDHQFDPQTNLVSGSDSFSVTLDEEFTNALLHEVPRAYHTQINDSLLTAFSRVLTRWTNAPCVWVDLEGHGRDSELISGTDVSRTLGWFTTIYPVCLQTDGVEAMPESIKRIKEQLREIPNRGIGFGLLRYLHSNPDVREALQSLPNPQVRFNYLGQILQSEVAGAALQFVSASEPCGPAQAPEGRRTHLLDVVAIVIDGKLRIDWSYHPQIHDPATIERLATQYQEELQSLISHCVSPEAGGYTPSDFPMMEMEQGELDELLEDLEFEDDN